MFKRFGWLAILLAGCGGAVSSSDDSTVPPVPVPVVLTGITILPGDATVDIDDTLIVSAMGQMSDGTHVPVSADWIVSDATVGVLSTPNGLTSSVSFLKVGTCDVHAAFDGQTAHVTLTVKWIIPTDPGPVYAVGSGGLRRWSMGIAAPVSVASASIYGVVLNKAGDKVYTLAGNAVNQIDPSTGAMSQLGTLPAQQFIYFGLDRDSQGRLYTLNGGGSVVRIDPSTGTSTPVGTASQYHNAVAVGPDDRVYTCSLYTMGMLPSIMRFNPVTGTQSPWSTMSSQVQGSGGLYCNAGIAINRRGEAFMGEMSGDSIYRHIDVNGDGDARDGGEVVRFATLPCGWGVSTTQMFGTTIARGGSVLVNCDQTATAASNGIYWLTDRNDNGNCDDADEVTLFNPTPVNNGTCSTCLSAQR